jgi:hypothetical protein
LKNLLLRLATADELDRRAMAWNRHDGLRRQQRKQRGERVLQKRPCH